MEEDKEDGILGEVKHAHSLSADPGFCKYLALIAGLYSIITLFCCLFVGTFMRSEN